MLSHDDNLWRSRQPHTTQQLLWKAHEFAIDLVVYCHYALKRREAKMRPETRLVLSETLRSTKGAIWFWNKWMRATYPKPEDSVPARLPQPHNHNNKTEVPAHATASASRHEDRG